MVRSIPWLLILACSMPSVVYAATPPGPVSPVLLRGVTSSNSSRREQDVQGDWTIARTGAPWTPFADWLPADDPAFGLMKRNPSLHAQAELSVRFSEEGQPEFCSVTHVNGDQTLTDRLCDRILPKARLVPAINRRGEKQWDVLKLYATFNPSKVPGRRPPPVIMQVALDRSPTTVKGLHLYLGDPTAIPTGAPKVEIWVNVASGSPITCDGDRLGNAIEVEKACGAAMNASYEDTSYNARALHIMFIGNDPRALLADPTRTRSIEPKSGLASRLNEVARAAGGTFDALHVRGVIGPDGRAKDCWLTATSGSDRADFAICDELFRQSWFEPARNVFGIARSDTLYETKLKTLIDSNR